jgi:hypothetical protein
MEVLALMKGDLAKVPNLAKRCKEFFQSLVGTKNPNVFYKEACDLLENVLIIPDELISEDFFPNDYTIEVIKEHAPRIMNYILNFEGSDEEFAEAMKLKVTNFVTVMVIELETGFGNFADVKKFVKANVDEMLTVASEPKNAKLTVMLGSPAIVNFFVKCHEVKPEPPVEETKAQVVVVETPTQAVAETLA